MRLCGPSSVERRSKAKGLSVFVTSAKAPDYGKPFVVQTDASEHGVGAVLSQCDGTGTEHPVAYFSHKLLPREQKYTTAEKASPLSWR